MGPVSLGLCSLLSIAARALSSGPTWIKPIYDPDDCAGAMREIWLFRSTIILSSPMRPAGSRLACLLELQMEGAALRPAWFGMVILAAPRHMNPGCQAVPLSSIEWKMRKERSHAGRYAHLVRADRPQGTPARITA